MAFVERVFGEVGSDFRKQAVEFLVFTQKKRKRIDVPLLFAGDATCEFRFDKDIE